MLGGWSAKRQPDLTEMILVVCGDLVEFIPKRAHAIYTVHPLQMAISLVVHAGKIDDRVADRFVDPPGNVQGHQRIVERLRPGILVHHRKDRSRLAEYSMNAIEEYRLGVGEVVENKAHRPLARPVCPCEVTVIEGEAFQRLVSRPFELSNE